MGLVQNGDETEANRYLVEASTIQKQGPYRWGHAHSVACLGRLALGQAHYQEAASYFYDSLILHLQLGDYPCASSPTDCRQEELPAYCTKGSFASVRFSATIASSDPRTSA